MSMRERGNLWPVVSVVAGAFFVLVIMPLILHRQKTGEMATVDAHVTIGDGGAPVTGNERSFKYRWPDSEVPRTAERLRDVTAVAIAASTSVIEGSLRGKIPRDAKELVAYIE